MKKIYLVFFLLLIIFSAGRGFAQTVKPVPYYPMVNWDTSPYKSFRYTRPNASWEWINFRLLYPNGYDSTANDGKEYPMIIMLHGAGESGRMEWNNTTKTNSPYPADDPRIDNNDHHLLYGGREHLSAVQSGRFPGFVLFPQNFFGTWVNGKGEAASTLHRDLQKVQELISYLIEELKVDPDRIYIHGLSNGGAGTWYAAYSRPDLFAAALPMSAPGDPLMAEQLAEVPLWVFQGELDTNPRPSSTLQTVDAVRNAGGTVRYTEYANTTHNTWNRAYGERDFFEWMLAQSKLPPNQAPTANAGQDVTIILPQNSVTLVGRASDSDGTILAYRWDKLDGPSVTMGGQNTANLNLTNLVEGVYLFRFSATDDRGGTASDEVMVTVNRGGNEPENQLPVVYAGDDKSITLPTNTASFTATASDSDGTIASYLWEKVSGPAATLSGQTTKTLSLSGLVAGNYTFKVTVTDDKGATASDQVNLVVNSAPVENMAPTVDAGQDRTITLPTNTATITANATDADGTIASYLWEKVSGPAVNMSNQTTTALSLSGLVEGSYVFRITVKDDKGATGTDEVALTVIKQSTASCQSLAMNGSNRLVLGNAIVLSGNFTIEYWAKLSSGINNADAPVSGGSNQFINYYNAQARLYSRGASGGHDPIVSSHKTVAGEWTHYAFVREGSIMKVYINGVEDKAATATNQWTGDLTINNLGQGYNGNFAGELEEVRIWNVARSGTNIQSNYNRSVAVNTTGLKAYFNFEEGAGVVKDISGNGFDSQSLLAGVSRTSSTAPLTDCGVVSEPNVGPVVNAGDDKSITLPTNTASFTATASDSDGTIASYLWEKVSGPAATLSGQTTKTLSLSGLVEGSYVFRITVKDDKGATASDQVNLNVYQAPVATSALRINAAGGSATAYGENFAADQQFSGGETKTYSNLQVNTPAGIAESGIYHSERYGNFSYIIPLASGTYQLRLHFAEVYWKNAGKRLFSVTAEGTTILSNYDIFAEAGFATAVVKEFNVSVTDGRLNLDFITSLDNAKVSAIEVISTEGGSQALQENAIASGFDKADQNKVSVYPNTFENELNIRIDSADKEEVYEVSLFDLQGRLIHKEQMNLHSGAASGNTLIMDLSGYHMPSGTYLIQTRGSNSSFVEINRVLKK